MPHGVLLALYVPWMKNIIASEKHLWEWGKYVGVRLQMLGVKG